MELGKSLANSLSEVLLDGKWVTGTNIKDEIKDLDWKTATMKIHDLNSIADLTFHIDYYLAGVLKVFDGGELEIRDKFSFDYEPIESQKQWEQLIEKFCNDSEKFVKAVSKMTQDELDRNFVKKEYQNYFRNITLMSEHAYYHLGQIMLIKKMIKQGNI